MLLVLFSKVSALRATLLFNVHVNANNVFNLRITCLIDVQ